MRCFPLAAAAAAAALAGLSAASPAVLAGSGTAPAPAPAPPSGPVLAPRAGTAAARSHHPVVDIPTGGRVEGRSRHGIDTFNTIPYAEPPLGPLRLRPPRRLANASATIDGSRTAPSCPQMWVSSASKSVLTRALDALLEHPWLHELEGQEDCLTLNVQRPAGMRPGEKLPVLFWIFGGAFEFGGSSIYDATDLLTAAGAQQQPFVFVAINYRVAGFGFLPGRQILADGSANLGLLDQRMALEWVADNIAAFGGDPDRVTIWGLSAGAISVFDQMVLYGGNASYRGRPLFRGAIMNSGSVAPAEPVDCPKAQAIYDTVAAAAGCSVSGSGPAADAASLECLRRLPYPDLLHAINAVPGFFSFNSLNLAFVPRPDGAVLPDSPDALLAADRVHAVPVIIGNQEDEGTMMALFQHNLTTVDDLAGYLADLYFPGTPREKLREFVSLYDPGHLQGSPFRTGVLNELYPGFKRVAGVLGDLTFTLSRRVLLEMALRVKPEMHVWSYLASYAHGLPVLGTFHALDIVKIFFGKPRDHTSESCRTYYFNFLYNLDPNRGVGGYAHWPLWREAKQLMWFRWSWGNDLIKDDFRRNASDWLGKHLGLLRI